MSLSSPFYSSLHSLFVSTSFTLSPRLFPSILFEHSELLIFVSSSFLNSKWTADYDSQFFSLPSTHCWSRHSSGWWSEGWFFADYGYSATLQFSWTRIARRAKCFCSNWIPQLCSFVQFPRDHSSLSSFSSIFLPSLQTRPLPSIMSITLHSILTFHHTSSHRWNHFVSSISSSASHSPFCLGWGNHTDTSHPIATDSVPSGCNCFDYTKSRRFSGCPNSSRISWCVDASSVGTEIRPFSGYWSIPYYRDVTNRLSFSFHWLTEILPFLIIRFERFLSIPEKPITIISYKKIKFPWFYLFLAPLHHPLVLISICWNC